MTDSDKHGRLQTRLGSTRVLTKETTQLGIGCQDLPGITVIHVQVIFVSCSQTARVVRQTQFQSAGVKSCWSWQVSESDRIFHGNQGPALPE